MYIRLTHPIPPAPTASTTVPIIGDPREPLAQGSSLVLPISNYVYDPGTGLWIPQVGGPGGTVLEYNSNRIASLLSALLDAAEEGGEAAEGAASEIRKLVAGIGVKDADTARLIALALGFRKVVGIDEGAYVSPTPPSSTIQFTGVNLSGRILFVWNGTERKFHWVTSVTDPVGATPGTITVDVPIQASSASLRIPFASVPHAYDLLADAERTNQLNPPQNHYLFDPGISVTIANSQPDTADLSWNVSAHNRVTVQVNWTCGSTATWQIDLLLRAAPGATLVNVNSFFRVAGTALGAAAGGTAGLFATTYDPIKAYELVVRRTAGLGAAPAAHSMTGSVNLHYA